VVESVKAASDVYAPVAGEVVEVNSHLVDSPETVNQDAYGEGWMFRLLPSDPGGLEALMDAAAYESFLESDSH
jgi:glycine cleavage system H protein